MAETLSGEAACGPLLGREVSVLEDGFAQAGTHRMTFDGGGLALEIYFVRLEAGSFSKTKKVITQSASRFQVKRM